MQVPSPFEYERATSVDHAIELLERGGGEARLVAGGHSLLPMMKLRLANPERLIDINDLVGELSYIRREGDEVRIGPMVRHRELMESDLLADLFPIFAEAERVIADPVVRNRGTIGGSLCQADPGEDLSAVCDALDATLVIRGPKGERTVSALDFQLGPFETVLEPGEMLTEIRLPVRPNSGSAYAKVERRVGDWAIAAAAASVSMSNGTIAEGSVALAAVGPNSLVHGPISELLSGAEPSEDLYAAAGAIAQEKCEAEADQRGTEAYKRHLANELTRRVLRRSVARATGQEA